MRIKFWGVRGSIPAPLKSSQVKEKIYQAIRGLPDIDARNSEAVWSYIDTLPPLLAGTAGGNTACVEIQAGGQTLIVDAGSGLRELGLDLMKGPCGRGQGVLHLFISHLHWDHIQGFPTFAPAFVPGNRLFIYGIHDLKQALEYQQRSPLNWPVDVLYMQADLEFVPLQVGESFSLDTIRVHNMANNHPGEAYSYRFEDQHSALVYASDSEFKQLDEASLQPYLDFFRDADALIFDAQYTLREVLGQKVDWGHSSALIGVDLARAAGVKKLLLFHHDPAYSDADLIEIQRRASAYQEQDISCPACQVIVAREGLTLDLTPPGTADLHLSADGQAAILTPVSIFGSQEVDQIGQQLADLSKRSNPIIDLSHVDTLTTAILKSLVSLGQTQREGPIILAAPSDKVRQVIELAGYQDYFTLYPSLPTALEAVQARKSLGLPGHVVEGRYQIQQKFGEGRLGVMLKAIDLQTEQTVTLKMLAPSFSQETRRQVSRRAPSIIGLDHPNVVRVFSWSQDADRVEEFVEGQTLRQFLQDTPLPLPGDQAMGIALDITRGLEYAHSRGVVHTNLRPLTVLLSQEGLKLCDFGLGRLVENQSLLEAPLLFLTPAYLAPEQILGQPLDARTDLYALGAILYHLLTGRPLYEGTDQQIMQAHLRQAPRPPRQLNPDISLSLEHLVLKLLAKNPNERYASAQQVRRIASSLVVGTEKMVGQVKILLVERKTQFQTLDTCWQAAQAGRGQLVFISGEIGIGKTSLAQQAAARCQAPVQLIGYCQDPQESPAYHLFTQVLRAYFATVPPEFQDESTHQLLANFIRLVPEIRHMLPDLADPPPLEPEQEHLRLMTSLTQFIKRATQERPWLLILDDLHWADPSSLELLRHLGRSLPAMALLIIGTYRDTQLESNQALRETLRYLGRHPTYRHLPLNRLDQAGVEQLLANLWNQPVPPALTQKIHQHTDGNPFYVEEVAKSLVDDGLITLQAGQWHFPDLKEVRLPPNVQEAVWGRLARLNPDTQTLLGQASVLGQVFKFDELYQMSGLSEWQVLEHLDMALERQLVQEVHGDSQLRFRHAEIQQALYADLGPLRRRLLHRRAGEILEANAKVENERLAEELAHHFDQAGEYEKAIVYSLQAARQAQAAFANEAALLWYRRTLDILGQLEPEQAARFTVTGASAHASLGEVLTLVGRYDEALEQYNQARELLESDTPTDYRARQLADLYRQIGRLHERQGNLNRALAWLEKGLEQVDENAPIPETVRILIWYALVRDQLGEYKIARAWLERALTLAQTGNLRQLEAESRRALGGVFWHLGDYARATDHCQKALHIQREIGDRRGEASSLNMLGIILRHTGDYAASQDYYEQSLHLYREVGDRRSEGALLNNLGVALKFKGDYAASWHYYEQALHIHRQVGNRVSESIALTNLGAISIVWSDYERATRYLEQSLRIKREIGSRSGQSEPLAYLGLIHHHQGNNQAARQYAQQALDLARELGEPAEQSYASTVLGHALTALGQFGQAGQAYQRAFGIRRALGQSSYAMEPLAGLARVALEQGALEQASAYVEDILRHLSHDTLHGTEEPLRIYLTCYHVLRASQDPRADEILVTAHTRLQAWAAEIDDEPLRRSFLEKVSTHREIVRAWQGRETGSN